MTDRTRAVLRQLAQGPATAKVLHQRLGGSLATVYRACKDALAAGWVAKRGAQHRILPAGQQALAAASPATPTRSAEPTLQHVVPQLQHTPTDTHRYTLELILCAQVARQFALRPDHHPAFFLAGPVLRMKTWIARAACRLSGIDETQFVLDLGTESGRSVAIRRGYAGKEVSRRGALAQPLVGLDEWLQADAATRRQLRLYLLGKLEVAVENETVHVAPVAVLTANPGAGDSLRTQLQLDAGTWRRIIPIDLSDVTIPKPWRAKGDQLLDAMRDAGPVVLPAPRHPTWDPSETIGEALAACVREEAVLAEIDIQMLAQLAAAATAWLERSDALVLVLHHYLALTAPLGWWRSDWAERLQTCVAMPTLANAAPPEADGDPEGGRTDSPSLPSFDDEVQSLAAYLLRHGLSPADAHTAVQEMAQLRAVGLGAATIRPLADAVATARAPAATAAERLASLLRTHGDCARAEAALREQARQWESRVDELKRQHGVVQAELDALDWTPEQVRALRRCDQALREVDVRAEDLAPLVAAGRALADAVHAPLGVALRTVRRLLQAITNALGMARGAESSDATEQALARALDVIAAAGAAGGPVTAQIDAMRAESRRLSELLHGAAEYRVELQAEIRQLERDAAPLRAAAQAAEASVADLRHREDFVEDTLAWLVHATAPTPRLLRFLRTACDEALCHPGDHLNVGHRFLAQHRDEFLQLLHDHAMARESTS